MSPEKKNVALLSACQGLLITNNSILLTTNGLAGYALASDKSLATLPFTAFILGAALTTMPASMLMRRYGRRAGFMLGAGFGIAGSLVCTAAMLMHNFWLLCAGAFLVGIYNANGQYYRFAAADSAGLSFKSKAISLVLAGGIVGGLLGPESSKYTKDFFTDAVFAGSYLSLSVFCLISLAVMSGIRIPPLTAAEQSDRGRPLREIARQPAFLVAVLSSVIGYGAMNLLMTATPLAMIACQHPFSAAALVIQWHVIGMYAPSFFTGNLIKRFGTIPVMLAGVAISLSCVAVALSGTEVAHFWFALVLLGIGWNFMFVGGTTLLTECHTPSERAKAQGVNDTLIFLTMAASSLSSGLLFTLKGWVLMNQMAVPFLVVTGAAMVWLRMSGRQVSIKK
jgi:MFS family permease